MYPLIRHDTDTLTDEGRRNDGRNDGPRGRRMHYDLDDGRRRRTEDERLTTTKNRRRRTFLQYFSDVLVMIQ